MKNSKKVLVTLAAIVVTTFLSVEAGYLYGNILNDFNTNNLVALKGGNSQNHRQNLEHKKVVVKSNNEKRSEIKIEQAFKHIVQAEQRIGLKEAQGKDVTNSLASIENSKEALAVSHEAFENGDFEKANEFAQKAKIAAVLSNRSNNSSSKGFGSKIFEIIAILLADFEDNEENDDLVEDNPATNEPSTAWI